MRLLRPNPSLTLLQVRHVMIRVHGRAQGVDQVVETLLEVLRLHRARAAHFIAHSFGTFVVANLCRQRPQVVRSSLLIDPVREGFG